MPTRRDLRRHPPPGRARSHAQLHRHPDSVNCSAHVAGLIADVFRRNPFTGDDPLAEYPNVDGVVALTHKTGCGMTESEPLRVLRRTLAGYARHVNFSHVVVLGLGCEVNQIRGLMEEQRLSGPHPQHGHPVDGRHAQDGGSRRGVREGGAGRSEPGAPRTGAGERTDRGAAMRRLGRLFRRFRQSRARCGERPAGAAWRHGDPVGNAGDLWRRTSADAPGGIARGGREAGRADALVGGLHRARGRGDERQSRRPATRRAG